MRHGSIATRLARATRADVAENPGFFADAARHGERHMQHLFQTDIHNALTGQTGPALFPNVRGAVKDIMGSIKMTRYNVTGRGLADMGQDDEAANAAAQGFAVPTDDSSSDSGGMVTSYDQLMSQPSSPLPAGTITSYSQLQTPATKAPAPAPAKPADSGFDWTKLATSIIGAGASVGSAVYTSQVASDTAKKAAAIQAAARAKGGVAQAGMFSGMSSTMLIVGAVAILGVGAVMAFKGGGNGGGGSRRRSKRRGTTKRRRR
jgi:hypothetical protein